MPGTSAHSEPCTKGTANCPDHSECANSDGSYACECHDGYKKPANGNNICKEINECKDGIHNCHEWAECTNTAGSFECKCGAGTIGNGVQCTQVDECKTGLHECDPNATCKDQDFGYSCSCNSGWVQGDTEFACVDKDECNDGTAECPDHSTCINNPGSYDCECNNGYKKPANGKNICKDINECDLDSIENVCGDTNAICSNTDGSYSCVCMSGFGRSQRRLISCPDIDECTLGTHNCSDNAGCTNTEGSFECSCNDGYVGDGVDCTDDDECKDGTADCPANSTCNNTIGGYECNCNDGWKKPANGNNICKDVDECKSDDTNNCPAEATCENNDGSYDCVCPEELYNTMVFDGINGEPFTVCEFRNQCYEGTDTCDEIAICTHVDKVDPRYLCTCPSGYDGDGFDIASGGSGCTDIMECDLDETICDHIANSECKNLDGGFQCDCVTGYAMNAAGTKCKDIDECASDDTNKCPNDATCTNTEGSYECICNDPLNEINEQDGLLFCYDINECFNDVDDCVDDIAWCTDTFGSYFCECKPGYIGDGVSVSAGGTGCEDSDECALGEHNCAESAECINGLAPGDAPSCECRAGYFGNGFTLISGGTGCTDINECVSDESNNCPVEADCVNTDGSFECVCVDGFDTLVIDGLTVCEIREPCFDATDCDDMATCTSGFGVEYICVCPQGYTGDGFKLISGGTGCVDIDECLSDDFYECTEPSSFCDNNEGSYDCICSNGFEENDVDGVNTCTDIDECARETHSCHEWAECVNTEPGYECLCQSGKG